MLNITNVKETAKGWYKEKETEIKAAATVVGVGLVGYVIGSKFTDLKTSIGLATMHGDGIIKFFDPVTGVEAKTSTEALQVMKNFYKKK